MEAAKVISANFIRRRTLVDKIIPVLIGAASVAASAQVSLPIGPVPITLQTLVVLLVGAILGPVRGPASILTYLAAGTAAPVLFAIPLGLAGPTGGYLIGFVLSAWVTGTLFARGWGHSRTGTLAALLVGTAAVYAVGLPWLAVYPWLFLGLHVMPVQQTLMLGFWPFLPGAALKIATAATILAGLRR